MNVIIKSFSFIFHPIFMPLLGLGLYFWKSPKYFSPEVIRLKFFSIFILTIALPFLFYSILKTLGKAQSIFLKSSKERIIPLIINAMIILIIIKKILPSHQIIELYYFFVGALISNLSCLILAILRYKASIHMIAISGVLSFLIALALHFRLNIIENLAILSIITGAVGSSRLILNAHTGKEIFIGTLIGLMPQLTLLGYWL